MVLDGNSAQKYPDNAGIPQGSILSCMLFLQCINDLPYHVISNIVFCAHDTTLYSKCGQASDLWQQLYPNCNQASDLWFKLESASKLESDLQDTVHWSWKWLVDFKAVKTQLVSFDRSNNTGAIDVKMDGSFLEKKSSFRRLRLTFSSVLGACVHYFLTNLYFSPNDSTSKTMKHVFYFI